MAGPQANPWDADPVVGTMPQTSIDGHPILIKPAPQVKPEFIPGAPGQVFDPNSGGAKDIPGFKPGPPADKITYRPMTPGEKTANHLSVDAPWQIGSTGEFKLPEGFKSAADKDNTLQTKDAIDAADALVRGVHRARGFITDGDVGPINTATGGAGNFSKALPWATDASKLQSVIDQEIRGNIFLKRIGDLKQENDSPTGGTGIGRIMQAEIPLITGAIGTLDPGKLGRNETLTSLQQIERSALRSKARLLGQDPDDPAVQQQLGIPPLPAGTAPPSAPGGTPPAAPGAGPTLGGTPPGGPPSGPSGGSPNSGPTIRPNIELAASDGTRAVVIPELAKIKTQLEQYLAADPRQVSNAMILGFLQKNGVNPATMSQSLMPALQYRMSPQGAAWRAKGRGYTVDPTQNVPLSTTEKVGNAVAQSSPGAAIMNAGNAATFGNMGNITGDKEGVDRALAVANAQHPVASLAGNVAGGASAAMGIEGLLAKLGLFSGGAEGLTELQTSKLAAGQAAKRAAAADTTYGGITGGTNAPQGQGLQGTAIGAMLGLGGNVVGRGVTKGAASGIEGVTSPTVSYVAREMPDALTIGQAVGQSGRVGKVVKGIEDRLSGLPVIGDTINARRTEGLQKMNSVAFDKALEPIGGNAAGKFGEEGVQHAQEAVGQAFTKALSGKTANLDHGFIVDAARAKNAIDALPDTVKGEVNNQVDHVINSYFDDNGQITGENLQAVLQELGGVRRAYQGTPLGHRIGKAVDQLSDGVEGMFQRQAPEVMPQYNAAKQAFKRVSTLEDAVLRAKNTGGVFTPAQLGFADKANTIKYGGKHAAAAGNGEFHDFQRNMQEVLPNKVPDSGTAGRLLVPAALLGAGAGGGALEGDTGKGLTLGALLSLAYSRTGQRALTSAVLKRGTGAQAAGQAVRKSARVVGHAVGTQTALGASRD